MTNALIIGANSAIAHAIAEQILEQPGNHALLRVSRSSLPEIPQTQSGASTVSDWQSDYSEQSIEAICSNIVATGMHIDAVFICNGVLHGNFVNQGSHTDFFPEKKLEDVSPAALSHVLQSNAMLPLLWLQNLIPLFATNHPCKVVCFSARVGSINDNRLGGWYSYRASKAALNMLLKTVSVEFSRRFKKVKLIAFHPGTTDTHLSKPFQANVPAGKLFTPKFVASQLLDIVQSVDFDGQLSYLDWNNNPIEF
ncbi:SDR family NAD(P)-dependent oxidoreductase [Thalassotalea sp. PS06]|uniref:SDR family NAD(P)-dependent oxidoreductase n=1 Tax=Thalassotalea sp. PS06 TaxID=2594005 RepID=UPI001161D7A4|nr:SDR family NAD(P)-dependent oxidoreductase [Thalassotalea sp. PS06]QDP01907.1 SDR family NAD(P)-dependent oxidoreductase [Thalassotalea sp. PS06]